MNQPQKKLSDAELDAIAVKIYNLFSPELIYTSGNYSGYLNEFNKQIAVKEILKEHIR